MRRKTRANSEIDASPVGTLTSWLARIAPGLPALLGYRREDLSA